MLIYTRLHHSTWRRAVIFSIHNHFEVCAHLGTSVELGNFKQVSPLDRWAFKDAVTHSLLHLIRPQVLHRNKTKDLVAFFSSNSLPPQAIKNWQDANSNSWLRATIIDLTAHFCFLCSLHDMKSFILVVKAATLKAEFNKLTHLTFAHGIYAKNKTKQKTPAISCQNHCHQHDIPSIESSIPYLTTNWKKIYLKFYLKKKNRKWDVRPALGSNWNKLNLITKMTKI